MTDAPERIWATGSPKTGSWNANASRLKHYSPELEYVRADLLEAVVKAAWDEVEAFPVLEDSFQVSVRRRLEEELANARGET